MYLNECVFTNVVLQVDIKVAPGSHANEESGENPIWFIYIRYDSQFICIMGQNWTLNNKKVSEKT